jgi:hypothetical protein
LSDTTSIRTLAARHFLLKLSPKGGLILRGVRDRGPRNSLRFDDKGGQCLLEVFVAVA